MRNFELKTKNLILTPIKKEDADYFFETWNDLKFRKFLFDDKYVSKKMVFEQIEKSKKSFAENDFGIWKLIFSNTNENTGFCGLRYAPDMPGEIGLLYGIERKFWGRGFAFEASQVILKYAFEDLEIKEIISLANPENVASWKILENLEMSFVNEIKTDVEILKVYRLKRSDYFSS